MVRQFATVVVEPHDDLMPPNIAAPDSSMLAVNVSATLVTKPMIDCTDLAKEPSQSTVISGTLTCKGRICVPVVYSLHRKVLNLFYDKPETGHFGAFMTTELVTTECYWPEMDSHLHKYGSDCELCHRSKASWDARHGISMTLETPFRLWDSVMMNFITDLPESTALGYTGTPITMDRLTMIAIYLYARKIFTPKHWPGSLLNTSFASVAFQTTQIQIMAPSVQVTSESKYVLTSVLTISFRQPSIQRQMGRQGIKIRYWSRTSRFSATISRWIGSNSCH